MSGQTTKKIPKWTNDWLNDLVNKGSNNVGSKVPTNVTVNPTIAATASGKVPITKPNANRINGPVTSNAYVNPFNMSNHAIEYTDTGSNKRSGVNFANTAGYGKNPYKVQGAGGFDWNAFLKQFGGGGIGGIGQFRASDAYNQAMAYTNSLLDKLNSGRSSYSDKIDELMNQINSRDKFVYDMDKDPMFQQYLQSSMEKGKLAMQDTIGQAAGLTGGYGSTYATSAANGAYNDFIKNAYDNVSDYYNMSLNAYNSEGQELYNRLGMYQNADQSEYSRLAAAYDANLAKAQMMYNQEYNNYWDTANYNKSVAQYNNNQKQDLMKMYLNALGEGTSSTKSSSTSKKTTSGESEETGANGLKLFTTSSNNKQKLEEMANLYMRYGSNLDNFNPSDSKAPLAPNTLFDDELDRLHDQGYDDMDVYRYIQNFVKEGGSVKRNKNRFGKKDDTYDYTFSNGNTNTYTNAEWQEILKRFPWLLQY